MQDGITWEEARTEEEKFFALTAPWSSLDAGLREHLGTSNLTARLSIILSALIAKRFVTSLPPALCVIELFIRLPELQEELQKLIQQTEEALRSLPKPPSADPLGEILHMISAFVQDVSTHVEGTSNPQGLLQAIRPAQVDFKKAIRSTAPNFQATRDHDEDLFNTFSHRPGSPNFLSNEEDRTVTEQSTGTPIYIDEVMKRANQYVVIGVCL